MASNEHVHRRGDEVSGRKYTRDTVLVRIVRTNNEEYIGAKSSADNAVSAVIQAGLFFRAKFLGKKGWNVLTRNNCFVFFFLFFVSFFFPSFLLIGLRLDSRGCDINFRVVGKGRKELVWRIRRLKILRNSSKITS